MDQKKQIIKLIKEVKFRPFPNGGGLDVSVKHQLPDHAFEAIADHLIANGMFLAPCKAGDTVYIIDDGGGEESTPYVLGVTVTAIGYDIAGFWITMSLPLGFKISAHCGESSFGKTVFLTEEEAKEKIKEMKKGDRKIN